MAFFLNQNYALGCPFEKLLPASTKNVSRTCLEPYMCLDTADQNPIVPTRQDIPFIVLSVRFLLSASRKSLSRTYQEPPMCLDTAIQKSNDAYSTGHPFYSTVRSISFACLLQKCIENLVLSQYSRLQHLFLHDLCGICIAFFRLNFKHIHTIRKM